MNSGEPDIPPPSGDNPSANETSSSKSQEEQRQEKEKAQKGAEEKRYAVNGAKINCPLCTNPMGTLMVTDLNPTVQNMAQGTESDNKKTNLVFMGTCSKSPNAASPCAAVIQPGPWQDMGTIKVNGKAPLIMKSTVNCMFGGSTIKITHCGQMMPPFANDDQGLKRETPPDESVEVRVSVFFDGTNNNKTNTEDRLEFFKRVNSDPTANDEMADVYAERLDKGKSGYDIDDSYSNDYSNVARLFNNYTAAKKVGRVYIEGIGTENDKDDSKLGGGFGIGNYGILTKVEKGCKEAGKRINELAKDKPISKITIDVFGFSRGAAAARNFIYEVTLKRVAAHTQTQILSGAPIKMQIPEQPAFGKLGRELKTYKGELIIAFAGLFDTVASYGLIKDLNVMSLHLDAVKSAKNVLHLTAMDERRTNFPLVNISSKNFVTEKSLPGVHCDVGGCYTPISYEDSIIVYDNNALGAEHEKRYLIEDGWFWNESQLEIKYSIIKSSIKSFPMTYLQSTFKKEIKNDYSFIPLHIMRKAAEGKPNYLKFNPDITKDFKIPSDLTYTNDRLNDYVFNGGKPMKYYTRKQLDQEIKMLQVLNNPVKIEKPYVAEASTIYIEKPRIVEPIKQQSTSPTPVFNDPYTNGQQKMRDQAVQYALEAEQARLANELNPSDYDEYPELKQKITDHQHIRYMRSKYHHISHRCSLLSAFTADAVAFYDPYSPSVRDACIRKTFQG